MTTFADKFSKFKIRFFIVFWILIFSFFLYQSFHFLKAVYSIYHLQNQYIETSIVEFKAEYNLSETIPLRWTPLNQISKRLQWAIISSEDGKFYQHPGYDLEQLRNAVQETFVYKKKMRGASTITQQLIKNLFLNHDKTFGRKIKELILALIIEKKCTKEKILESYLNIIEYGKGLFGIHDAALFYFNKKPAQLTSRESAFIAMLLPSPIKYSRSFKNHGLSDFAKNMVESILLKMRQAGAISEIEYQEQLISHFSWETNTLLTNKNTEESSLELDEDDHE